MPSSGVKQLEYQGCCRIFFIINTLLFFSPFVVLFLGSWPGPEAVRCRAAIKPHSVCVSTILSLNITWCFPSDSCFGFLLLKKWRQCRSFTRYPRQTCLLFLGLWHRFFIWSWEAQVRNSRALWILWSYAQRRQHYVNEVEVTLVAVACFQVRWAKPEYRQEPLVRLNNSQYLFPISQPNSPNFPLLPMPIIQI